MTEPGDQTEERAAPPSACGWTDADDAAAADAEPAHRPWRPDAHLAGDLRYDLYGDGGRDPAPWDPPTDVEQPG